MDYLVGCDFAFDSCYALLKSYIKHGCYCLSLHISTGSLKYGKSVYMYVLHIFFNSHRSVSIEYYSKDLKG